MSGLPSLRAVLLMVTAVLAVTIAAGGVVLVMGEDPSAGPAGAGDGETAREADRGPGQARPHHAPRPPLR
ncbi:hypothetical protein ACFSTC_14750 [Nonomuraea ferruginea]